MIILGLNAYHGDVSAVLLRDGELLAAVEEERFRRIKHVAGFPTESIRACLELGGVTPREIDRFAVSRNPRAHLWRKIWFGLRRRPQAGWIGDRLENQRRVAKIEGRIASALDLSPRFVSERLHRVEHHPAHLASAFYPSPFERAAVCALDGFGDFVSTSTARGLRGRLEVLDRIYFPHSLGLVYLAITQFLGFHCYGDEYKVMGLAPYGEPDFVRQLGSLLDTDADGGFQLDLRYFGHWSRGVEMTWDDGEPKIGPVYTAELERLLGPARGLEDPIEPRHQAIAASLQVVFEEAVFHLLNALARRTGERRLCLAGGCAMNSVANGKIPARTDFEEVYVQPAAGDSGTALGAALHLWHETLGEERRFEMRHAYWGPEFDDARLKETLAEATARREMSDCQLRRFSSEELVAWTAERIAAGRVVGWFQGRMEWGPRALGNRSILADPRRPDMGAILNEKIKFRETFRPFAPAILEESVDDWFERAVRDPFMSRVLPIRSEKQRSVPAVTHVDGSGRLQTVSRSDNPLFWNLIRAFEELSGVPMLLNTSFNENEPIVNRPEEALQCFLRTDMDVLVMGHHVVEKREAPARPERPMASVSG